MIIDIINLCLLLVLTSMVAHLYSKSLPSAEQRTDARVEKELMDEGFENIMRYEVNGKTGFEE